MAYCLFSFSNFNVKRGGNNDDDDDDNDEQSLPFYAELSYKRFANH
jgi:hypothetical protein